MVEAVEESVSVADVVSDPQLKVPIEPEFPRRNRGR
jgi:hypothetical protein